MKDFDDFTDEQQKTMIKDLIDGYSENIKEVENVIKKSQVITNNNHVVYNAELSVFVEVFTDDQRRMIDAKTVFNPKYLKTHLTKEDALKVEKSLSCGKGKYEAWNFIEALNHQKKYYQEKVEYLKNQLKKMD